MGADGQADKKTRERTEGAAKAVQAMHGDSFSASRVDPGPKTNSTCFGVKRPNLPLSLAGTTSWSRTALRRPSRVSHPWRCAKHHPSVTYFPPAKSLQQERPPSTSHLFGSTQPNRQIYGLQLHPPGATAVSGDINCLLPPSAGESSRQNQGKIGCLIQVVLKSRSSPRLPVFGNVARVVLW